MAASQFKLDNLTTIVDYNRIQVTGFTDDLMSLEPLVDKWRAFGWDVTEAAGHDITLIGSGLMTHPCVEALLQRTAIAGGGSRRQC